MFGKILDLLKEKNVKQLNQDQKTQMMEAQEYLQTHNIEMLFKELLAAVIETQPESAKDAIIEALQRKTEDQHFFNDADFEVLFDNFDPFETKNLSVNKVVQGRNAQIFYYFTALKVIGIESDEELIKSRYEEITQKGYIYKDEFIEIVKSEYLEQV